MFEWYTEKAMASPYYKGQPIVVYKGTTYPTFLWIGEAPCRKAAITREPFSGISGKILDKWMAFLGGYKYNSVINVVPFVLTEHNNSKLVNPSAKMMSDFAPLCKEIIECFSPRVTITLGDSVRIALNNPAFLHIKHPAWYARQGKHNYIPEEVRTLSKRYFPDGLGEWW